MKRVTLLALIICVSASFAYSQTPASTPVGWVDGSGGTISNIAELRWLSETSEAWDEDWVLSSNIDASETSLWNAGAGFNTIGNATTKFTGNFDGAGYEISDLYINRPADICIGMIGYSDGGTIENLSLICDVTGQNNTGGLLGIKKAGTVRNCTVSGSVTGNWYTGGLVGQSRDNSEITKCYSLCDVTGDDFTGVFVGLNYSANINNCFARGSVGGTGSSHGGFVGSNATTPSISYCYAASTVDGDSNMGGFAGTSDWGTISNSHYDSDVSGLTGSNYGSAQTTSEMKNQSTYTGWDFSSIWGIYATENDGYPYLKDLVETPDEGINLQPAPGDNDLGFTEKPTPAQGKTIVSKGIQLASDYSFSAIIASIEDGSAEDLDGAYHPEYINVEWDDYSFGTHYYYRWYIEYDDATTEFGPISAFEKNEGSGLIQIGN